MARKGIVAIIQFYQLSISPYLGNNCRFEPTCSNYAIESYEKHSILKATMLVVWRLLRCNPFSKGGYDPVP